MVKIILIVRATNAISERSFSTLKWVISLSTNRTEWSNILKQFVGYGRLNSFHMIHIYNKELHEINMKLTKNKFHRVKKSTFGLNQFWAKFILIHISLLLNPFLLCFHSIPFEIIKKILRFSDGFREYWQKTLERNGLILSWMVFNEVRTKPNPSFWTSPISPYAHMYIFELPPPPEFDTCVIFFLTSTPFTTTLFILWILFYKRLQNIKPIDKPWKTIALILFNILVQWLQRKCKDFLPTYLYQNFVLNLY